MSLCTWSGVSSLVTIAFGILIAIAMASSIPRKDNGWVTTCELALSWVCTTTAAVILLVGPTFWSDSGQILAFIMAWATAASMIPAILTNEQSARCRSWKIQIVFWCLFGTLLFLYDACLQNSVLRVYAGLTMNCLIIIGCKLWFRPPQFVILCQNTTILLLIGLPVAIFLSVRHSIPESTTTPTLLTIIAQAPPTREEFMSVGFH